MARMMSQLANVPLSTITSLDPQDWTGIAWSLAPFFLPRPGTTSSTPASALALVFKCDPFVFLEKPEHVIRELYRRTLEKLHDERDDDG